ncbi:MAG: 50S ribosomal protein L29 [bacterium]
MKAAQLRDLEIDELDQKLKDLKQELFNLRFRNASKRVSNPLRIRTLRRDIARVLTIMNERQREKGSG